MEKQIPNIVSSAKLTMASPIILATFPFNKLMYSRTPKISYEIKLYVRSLFN